VGDTVTVKDKCNLIRFLVFCQSIAPISAPWLCLWHKLWPWATSGPPGLCGPQHTREIHLMRTVKDFCVRRQPTSTPISRIHCSYAITAITMTGPEPVVNVRGDELSPGFCFGLLSTVASNIPNVGPILFCCIS